MILAMMAVWLGGEYGRAEDGRILTRQSYEHRRDIEQLFSLVQDAETGQRGYIISGNRSFLKPYEDARARLPGVVARMERSNPHSEGRAEERQLAALIQVKLAEMQEVIELRDRQGFTIARDRLSEGAGKRLMDDIRTRVAKLIADESRLLEANVRKNAERTSATQQLIWLAIAIIAAIVAIAGYMFGQNRRLRNELALDAADAAARQHAIFNSVSDAIILINPSGSIETINPAAETIFGYRTENLLRRDISTLVELAPGEGSFLDRVGYREGTLDHPARMDLVGHCANGNTIALDVVLSVMPLPDGVHIVAALRDASARKQVERLKDEFISTVSHELRTPLTSVLGSLSLLRGGAAGDLPPPAQRLAEIAENNCQRLIRLINDILDIDQLRTGKLAFDQVTIDLRDVAIRATQAMNGLADRKQIDIAQHLTDAPAMVHADVERLIQVTTNLLSNAIKYSPDGSTIDIEIVDETDRYVVRITDKGPGIAPEFAPHIFGRFAQGAQPEAKMIAGTGLGLAISREIVHTHGGEIWFENVEGAGACFGFSVPYLANPADRARNRFYRILVCEDDADVGETVRTMLASKGYDSDLAPSVQEAASLARNYRYDVILLDMTLSDSDGADVLRALHTGPNDGTRRQPVIVISGAPPSREVEDIPSAEIIDWLRKPFDTNRLIHAVERALDRAGRDLPLVLHVDDDGDTRELFVRAMAGHGRVITAHSIDEATGLLERYPPDLVVLDLGLPDGNGASMLPKLVDGAGNSLPIVVYTAQDVDDRVRGNVDAVLVKSRRSLPDLVAAVNEILEKRREAA
ncbi:response regulator [Sphingomonas montanisoli]|uniref:histidine kinase n=2 Tax=Sphingomonas montanisoli TaxID=2606412 RepID=A0A5D9C876_9SPHN|nr:response regulator [Sphingomonas montanisoli]